MVTMFEKIDDFELSRSQFKSYDLSRFVPELGHDRISCICREIRRIRDEDKPKHRTWQDGYVVPTLFVCECLTEYRTSEGHRFDFATTSYDCCQDLLQWVHDRIWSLELADVTKSNRYGNVKHLLQIFAIKGILPAHFLNVVHADRVIARIGRSRFTVSGWARIPKEPFVQTPFSFEVPQHGRSYDFSEFQCLGASFLSQFTVDCEAIFRHKSATDAKKVYNVTKSLFRYLVTLDGGDHNSLFLTQLRSAQYRTIDSLVWEQILYSWRDFQRDGLKANATQRKLLTAHQNVKLLGRFWEGLASRGLVPAVTLKGFLNAKKRSNSTPRKSLAQLTASEVGSNANVQAAVAKISKFFGESDQRQVAEFICALCTQLPAQTVRDLSTDELVREISELNAQRLKLLRTCAEHEFLKWRAHWEAGQAAIGEASHSGSELVDLLDSPFRLNSERRANASKLIMGGDPVVSLGNSLNLIIEAYGGLISGVHGRYHHIKRRFGGGASIDAYIHPHPHASVAIWTMLQIDTAANCEVVREMPFNCFEACNDPAFRRVVFARKGRANDRIIENDLPIVPTDGQVISSVAALLEYRQMTNIYRERASADVRDSMFLMVIKGEILPADERKMRDWFKSFVKAQVSLKGLEILPAFLRPSVLMETQYRSPEGVIVAQVVADHVSATTTETSYTGRVPARLQYAQSIRTFQNRYQAVVIASITDSAKKLGISNDEFHRILSDAARTGLGVACLNPFAGVQPGTRAGDQCTKFESCCGCAMRWVVATVENVADLILFHEHLSASEQAAIASDPERWEHKWLPWLVFAEIALKKLSQGETARVHAEAIELAATRRVTYTPFPLV